MFQFTRDQFERTLEHFRRRLNLLKPLAKLLNPPGQILGPLERVWSLGPKEFVQAVEGDRQFLKHAMSSMKAVMCVAGCPELQVVSVLGCPPMMGEIDRFNKGAKRLEKVYEDILQKVGVPGESSEVYFAEALVYYYVEKGVEPIDTVRPETFSLSRAKDEDIERELFD